MNVKIILGLGFGDEGKGATVNSLITDPKNTIVVRFNGGHQVGHTVYHNNIRHPFSNFGSGTLKGVPTYWSEFCTVNPMAVDKEGEVLRKLGLNPLVYFDANAMVTTPYDIYQNIRDNNNLNHGTVGVGFGKTIQRNEEHYHLYMRDLLFPKIRDEKLELISKYYCRSNKTLDDLSNINFSKVIDKFKSACDELLEHHKIVNSFIETKHWNNEIIFEGGQGIMLDMDYGFFPNVTRSNTTSKNAIHLINKWGLENRQINTFYVTRAYQTRHGNGFMSNENINSSSIKINPNETNTNDGTQGVFRRAILDVNQLQYALMCDSYHNRPDNNRNLVVTCLDHVDEEFPVTLNGDVIRMNVDDVANQLAIKNKFSSFSEKGFQY